MTLIFLWIIIIGILLLIYLAFPLWSSKQVLQEDDVTNSALQQLDLQRELSYSALVDLDEDYEVGKLSDKDYQTLRQELLRETAEILNRIESPNKKSLEDEIEEYKERHQLEEQ
tara:strand:- start:278 stop:619 length:342 start_codon:yes stop_codon:yes gene_type:complete